MNNELDYEKLDRLSKIIEEAANSTKDRFIEDAPFEYPKLPEEAYHLTDEEIQYIFFGVKPK
ncbi:hypothetical protein [Staphylococcus simulans]|uniref:hypothetical protein n=1 Tax=Staphylococcus simulans TaxID=1286 RepID=UPI000D03B090|nr:hypothetical protein [Staphylococcus simulans]